ncbi:unnamed protein product [Microthlaspi erraticum]|uniref:Uncharacterized protein n=1 Tax=Microthlaspi erraticum TaxID=1685480 RepID=A0A6D2HM45_9BRAS|nr:unnamed protein product [Microthlaspi erraticum]
MQKLILVQQKLEFLSLQVCNTFTFSSTFFFVSTGTKLLLHTTLINTKTSNGSNDHSLQDCDFVRRLQSTLVSEKQTSSSPLRSSSSLQPSSLSNSTSASHNSHQRRNQQWL